MNNDIQLSPHFRLREFTESDTARKHGIDNNPPPEAVGNLRRLCEGCLEPLREALGLPVVVTSGFRTKELNNKLAHSSERSQHMLGQAADFYVVQGPVSGSKFNFVDSCRDSAYFKQVWSALAAPRVQVPGLSRRELLVKAFRTIILDERIDYDQLIIYPTFIHVSFVSKERNRRNTLKARGDGKLGYGRLSLSSALQIT